MKKVLLIDEQITYRKGIMRLLEIKFPTCSIQESNDFNLNSVQELPDLLIIDPFNHANALEIIDYFIKNEVDIVILSSVEMGDNNILNILKKPIKGFLLKNMDTLELIRAFYQILKGKRYIHPDISNILLDYYHKSIAHKKICVN